MSVFELMFPSPLPIQFDFFTSPPPGVRSIFNERVCMSVYLSFCSHISKTICPTSRNFLCMLSMAVARFSADNRQQCNTLCTSGFVDDVMFLHNGTNTDTGLSLRRSELFTVSRQVAPLNCAPGTKSAIIDCLVNFLDSLFLCPEHRLTAANARLLITNYYPKRTFLGVLTPI